MVFGGRNSDEPLVKLQMLIWMLGGGLANPCASHELEHGERSMLPGGVLTKPDRRSLPQNGKKCAPVRYTHPRAGLLIPKLGEFDSSRFG